MTSLCLHCIWSDWWRGAIYHPMLLTLGSVVCGFSPPRQSHIHICLKKQSKCQAAFNTSSTPEAKAVPSLSNNRELEVWIIWHPVHQRRVSDELATRLVSQHPTVALAVLQAQDKEPAVPTNAASGSKRHLFYRWRHLVKHGLIIIFLLLLHSWFAMLITLIGFLFFSSP